MTCEGLHSCESTKENFSSRDYMRKKVTFSVAAALFVEMSSDVYMEKLLFRR
jgi:hypothetical protein